MNQFLRSHRVLAVKKEFVPDGENSFWTFCIDSPESSARVGAAAGRGPKVDYRGVSGPEELEVFSRLRDWPKGVAELEGVPVYAVLTNEQQAQMVRKRANTQAGLKAIEGIGEARVAKYGDAVLEMVAPRLEPGDPGRQLEPQRQELPGHEPQQQLAGQQEQQHRVPVRPPPAQSRVAGLTRLPCCSAMVRWRRQTAVRRPVSVVARDGGSEHSGRVRLFARATSYDDSNDETVVEVLGAGVARERAAPPVAGRQSFGGVQRDHGGHAD